MIEMMEMIEMAETTIRLKGENRAWILCEKVECPSMAVKLSLGDRETPRVDGSYFRAAQTRRLSHRSDGKRRQTTRSRNIVTDGCNPVRLDDMHAASKADPGIFIPFDFLPTGLEKLQFLCEDTGALKGRSVLESFGSKIELDQRNLLVSDDCRKSPLRYPRDWGGARKEKEGMRFVLSLLVKTHQAGPVRIALLMSPLAGPGRNASLPFPTVSSNTTAHRGYLRAAVIHNREGGSPTMRTMVATDLSRALAGSKYDDKHLMSNEVMEKTPSPLKSTYNSQSSRNSECPPSSKPAMANRLLDWFSVVMADSKHRRPHPKPKGTNK
ncbi:hypothetical protein WN48_09456 [Eufriesea mexicana]|uniref:Uncharacterized protein n=1 Tax=Eufriesea mexicana TaxID=516756 RepID=A0A310SHF6_9HYME|nr:hypothetical protein WN48_09456 [Eufriesea mexicana]